MNGATVASLCISEGTKIQCLFKKHCLKVLSDFGNVLSLKSNKSLIIIEKYI